MDIAYLPLSKVKDLFPPATQKRKRKHACFFRNQKAITKIPFFGDCCHFPYVDVHVNRAPLIFNDFIYTTHTFTKGNYFPILRVSNWATKQPPPFITNKAVLAFIYLFGIVFVCMSLVSAYLIWVYVRLLSSGQRINLGLVVFFFMFLFNIGMFLILNL